MEAIRRQIDAMAPWQRNTLVIMIGVAFVLVVVLVVAAANSGESPITTAVGPTVTTAPSVPVSTTQPPTPTVSSTIPAPTTTAAVTTTTEPPTLELRPDGLGDLTFGVNAEVAISTLRSLIGDPDEDTGWVNQLEAYGTCIGTEIRFVRWGSLQIFLTDGPSDWAPAGVRHLANYADSSFLGEASIPALTIEEIGIGSTVADVTVAYGVEATIEDDPLFGPSFFLDTPGAGFLFGILSGVTPSDRLLSLSAGFACGE